MVVSVLCTFPGVAEVKRSCQRLISWLWTRTEIRGRYGLQVVAVSSEAPVRRPYQQCWVMICHGNCCSRFCHPCIYIRWRCCHRAYPGGFCLHPSTGRGVHGGGWQVYYFYWFWWLLVGCHPSMELCYMPVSQWPSAAPPVREACLVHAW